MQHDETEPAESPPQEEGDVVFPLEALAKLDEMISKPRWVVPVLPKGELEILLEAAIAMCKKGKVLQVE